MIRPAPKTYTGALLVVPALLLSACAPNEPVATAPYTAPPVWTGSPLPAGGGHGAAAHGGGAIPGPVPNAPVGPGDTLTAQLNGPDGSQVAAATIEFRDGVATVMVQTTAPGKLTPGAHGLHLHTVGKCEINSVAPAGGAPGDFLSAGGHFQGGGSPDHPGHAGDLTSLQVRPDGTAMLVTTTTAFTREQLLAEPGTAIIIHAGPDNFANIPADRYQQTNGSPPPDATTLATGDGGKRVACGVVGTG
jgi:Cu-Zn family superoxide dismutase